MTVINIKPGERAFITGTSGSGKSTFALRLCEVMPSPLVILDTKYDPGIEQWAKKNKIYIRTKKDMPDWRKISTDMVIRPPAAWIAYPPALDRWLGGAFSCRYVPSIYIDELYSIGATANKFGPGIAGLWTRGRAFGMRILGGAQRPAWISKFVVSESNVLFVGTLHVRKDRAALSDATGFLEILAKQPDHAFLYVRQDGSPPIPLAPLDLTQPSNYDPRYRSETLRRMKGIR